MPRGSKAAYSSKQKRKARHIEEGYEERGLSEKEAERRAWATVNKQDGGAKKKKSAASSRPRKATATRKKAAAGRKSASQSSRATSSRTRKTR